MNLHLYEASDGRGVPCAYLYAHNRREAVVDAATLVAQYPGQPLSVRHLPRVCDHGACRWLDDARRLAWLRKRRAVAQ